MMTVELLRRPPVAASVPLTRKSRAIANPALIPADKVGKTEADTVGGGSGSTLIAAEQMGRKCRMLELDEKYCDVVRRRWAEFKQGEGCDWQRLTSVIANERKR
ncbi:MAG: site-specific DNA-methyltransferase [Puniceicoccales bacterium]|nr:site-specific DNA-methyltransferase [Puniceicoccales bacterium]